MGFGGDDYLGLGLGLWVLVTANHWLAYICQVLASKPSLSIVWTTESR